MDIVPTSKTCSKCRETKPLEEFNKNKNTKDGLESQCKDCRKQHYQANRKQIRESHREYYLANTDQILAYKEEYRAANRERLLAYRQAHREQIREYDRRYRQANPHIGRAAVHRRRAHRLALPSNFTTEHMAACLEYFNNTCAYCGNQFVDLFGEVSLNWDHFIPLASDDCPGTVPENMLCTCSDCNNSKHAKLPTEWLIDKFGTRKAKQIMTRIEQYFDSLMV